MSTVFTVWTRSSLPLYTVSADSAVCHVLTESGCLLRSVSTYAICDRFAVFDLSTNIAVFDLSTNIAVCHVLTEPGCLLRSVSAYAMFDRFAVLDLPADITVRDLCAKSCDLLRAVSADIKSAMCYL